MQAPREIRYRKAARILELELGDGQRYTLPAEYLRVYSPSAEVRGHGGGEPLLLLEKEQVAIERIEPVGNYAVRLIFSDGHSSGLFSWEVLNDLGTNQARLWARYLERLQKAGYVRKELHS